MTVQENCLSSGKCREIFRRIKCAYDAKPAIDSAVVCKVGDHVLKLQKPAWTNDDMRNTPNRSGIFFSIWWDGGAEPVCRANYNIHALKLRQLRGFKITSRDFAEDFRRRFRRAAGHWPNVSTEFGPLTLMQGWIDVVATAFEADVIRLMNRFLEISPIIDELLEKRRNVAPLGWRKKRQPKAEAT
jgi:hypothetical protein